MSDDKPKRPEINDAQKLALYRGALTVLCQQNGGTLRIEGFAEASLGGALMTRVAPDGALEIKFIANDKGSRA